MGNTVWLSIQYGEVIIRVMASWITSLTIVYWTVYSGPDQRKCQSSTLLAFVRGIHQWPANLPHKGPVMQKVFPFDDIIMNITKPQWGNIFKLDITCYVKDDIWSYINQCNNESYILFSCGSKHINYYQHFETCFKSIVSLHQYNIQAVEYVVPKINLFSCAILLAPWAIKILVFALWNAVTWHWGDKVGHKQN